MPEPWGLLEAHPQTIRVVRQATHTESSHAGELALLLAETRRVAEGWRKAGSPIGLQYVEPLPEEGVSL